VLVVAKPRMKGIPTMAAALAGWIIYNVRRYLWFNGKAAAA